jgi:hypothetical protein
MDWNLKWGVGEKLRWEVFAEVHGARNTRVNQGNVPIKKSTDSSDGGGEVTIDDVLPDIEDDSVLHGTQ